MKNFKYIAFLILLSALLWSCKSDNTLRQNSLTIILKSESPIPEDNSVFISGSFEGWSGGNQNFILNAKEGFHQITLPDTLGDLQFKFTLGSWETVEVDKDGNDLSNRIYQFSKPNDTLYLTTYKWSSSDDYKNLVLPKNLSILSYSLYIPQLDRYRRIWVYTPPEYETSKKNYPVVYMQDGQNLFMDETAFAGEWKVDETLNALSKYHDLNLIVVGIDHGDANRINEMSPYVNKYAEKPEADLYLDFIVKTLKPKIDSTFRTLSDQSSTAILGSSMGGLLSHYAGLKYSDVFGKIGVLSPSFWISDDVFEQTKNIAYSNNLKYYMLAGDEESSQMTENAERMHKTLVATGIPKDNLAFKIVNGGKHNETFWSGSLAEVLCWLFDKPIPENNPLIKDIQLKSQAQIQLSAGEIKRIDAFPSKYIKSRPVDIWLPENYSAENKYNVLYMHDGQMLFDANSTWNKQEWKVDEWASKLMTAGDVEDFIVVAVHNIPELRWQDLFPQKAFEFVSDSDKENVKDRNGNQNISLNGDNYLRFLVKELKPYIDKSFSTKTDKENTFVMGSSMGGLMSMYAISEYPEVFGGAACLSTHWVGAQPIEDNPLPEAIFQYMQQNLPNAGSHKLYFDYGNKTLDAFYPQYASRVDDILKVKSYKESNAKNLFFEGEDHSENSWNKRLDKPLVFLMGKD